MIDWEMAQVRANDLKRCWITVSSGWIRARAEERRYDCLSRPFRHNVSHPCNRFDLPHDRLGNGPGASQRLEDTDRQRQTVTAGIRHAKAARELSRLAAFRLPVIKHTPFFICALTLSSIVQLATCSAA
jgi:hypothetical protein